MLILQLEILIPIIETIKSTDHLPSAHHESNSYSINIS